MRTKNELYQEALRTVAARRQMARARAEDARAEAEAAVPALRHAEDEVRVRGLRCALAGASGKDRTAANAALFNGEWKKGHPYTYNLQLDKNDITLKSVEIKAWTEKDGGSQDVPPVIE